MRSSLVRTLVAITTRVIKPATQIPAKCLTRNVCCLSTQTRLNLPNSFQCEVKMASPELPAHVHQRYFHLVNALCKKRRRGFKRGCGEKKRKRKHRCVKNPRVCLQDLHKHDRRKHNPNCCPCKEWRKMDPYRRQ